MPFDVMQSLLGKEHIVSNVLPLSSPLKGVLNPDGTLRLEEHPGLPPGPVEVFIRPRMPDDSPTETRDWWEVLQEIQASQKKRGFVGNVTEFDRDDEDYEARMKAIHANTVHPPESN